MSDFLNEHDPGQIVYEYKDYQLVYLGYMNGKKAGHEFFITNFNTSKSFTKNLGEITLEQAKKEMLYSVDEFDNKRR